MGLQNQPEWVLAVVLLSSSLQIWQ
jgi:hypothetical protein